MGRRYCQLEERIVSKRLIIKRFSLVELIVVVAIILLSVGLIIPRLSSLPVFVQLDNSVNRVKGIFLEASNQSLVQGRKIEVKFEGNKIYITNPGKKNKNAAGHSSFQDYYSYELPKEIVVTFEHSELLEGASGWDEVLEKLEEDGDGDPDEDEERVKAGTFTFYPDGSADGPSILFAFEKEKMKLFISPLTGILNSISVDEDGEEELD